MPKNNYFQFKQFRIDQNHAAMRVGTDGVLLGAWTGSPHIETALDIGTGTGLIALMLAQKTGAAIHAIDIDEGAVTDALHNFRQSAWSDRLSVELISVQDFVEKSTMKFDCITCNPPFFDRAVKPVQNSRLHARHTDSLSFADLTKSAAGLLNPDGNFSVILPVDAENEFRSCAAVQRLFPTRITTVKPNFEKPAKRVLIEFRFEGEMNDTNELVLETEKHHVYTPEATALLKTFYLKL